LGAAHFHKQSGSYPFTKEIHVADRELKMPAKKINKDAEEEEIGRVPSQRQRPESGRYLLQVDRQTKSSFKTFDDAHSAALKIKKSNPVIQVAVYDSVDHLHTLVDVPTE
jgi:hypothetical protein